jgi:hypothetical protein
MGNRIDYMAAEGRGLIRMEETPALWAQEKCSHCGQEPERRWLHLNVCQLQSEIVCALPRGECPS